MSYKVSKTISVPYIDHEYTLSRSGDSVEVHTYEVTRHKDVDINIHVDTTPFDQSVEDCAEHVEGLTASIGGFKAAHVLAKQQSRDQIINSATAGFTNMIEQSINMQSAGHDASMKAVAGELMQQCQELNHKHEVMNSDYNRIKGRYLNLFNDLDKELKRRILFLTKPCFDFVDGIRKEQNRRISSSLLSTATLGARENEAARTAIQASKVKGNATQLIAAARDHIAHHAHMENMMKAITTTGSETLTYYVPAMMYQRTDEQGTQKQIVANPTTARGLAGNGDQRFAQMAERPMSTEERRRIDNHFNQLVEQHVAAMHEGRRLADIIRHLYHNTEFTTYSTNH